MRTLEESLQALTQNGLRIRRQAMRFTFGSREVCETLFYRALSLVDTTKKEFERLPEYSEVIDWMTDTRGQGLLLQGSCGRGKSNIIRGILPAIFLSVQGKVLSPMTARNMSANKDIFRQWAYCIDDIGTESISSEYGVSKELFVDVIEDAEDYLKPVFISTNLNGSEILSRYGVRVADRIVRLCRVVKFKGKSLRHPLE